MRPRIAAWVACEDVSYVFGVGSASPLRIALFLKVKEVALVAAPPFGFGAGAIFIQGVYRYLVPVYGTRTSIR